MTPPILKLVGAPTLADRAAATKAAQAALVAEAVAEFIAALQALTETAAFVATLDGVPVGVREMARQISPEAQMRATTVVGLMGRAGR